MRADVAAEMPQVFVRPGWAHLAIKPGLAVMRVVPAKPETIAVGRGVAFQRPHALHHERVGRRRDIALEFDRFPAIGDPTAHRATPSGVMITPETGNLSARIAIRRRNTANFRFQSEIHRCRQTNAALT